MVGIESKPNDKTNATDSKAKKSKQKINGLQKERAA